MAVLIAIAASLMIIVNAVFLQSHVHPAPFFSNPAAPPPNLTDGRSTTAVAPTFKPAEQTLARPSASSRSAQAAPARHDDPIGDLIGSSVGTPARVTAVQRVLAEYGYGQIKPTGVLDQPTSAAIQKFESEHKLPVTGRLSDRLLSELSALAGRPLE